MKKLIFILILLMMMGSASAFESDVQSSPDVSTSTATIWATLKTFTHSPESDEIMDLYQVKFDMSHSSASDRAITYAILAKSGSRAEVELAQVALIHPAGQTITYTLNLNPEDFEEFMGEDVVVRIRTSKHVTWTGSIYVSNASSSAYVIAPVTLISPANNSYVNTTQFYFSIPSAGNVELYVDNEEMAGYYSSYAGTLSIPSNMAQGNHSWYMRFKPAGSTEWEYTDPWYLTYDTIAPTIIDTDVLSNDVVAQGNDIVFNVKFQEANVDTVEYYVDSGDGYELVDTKYADGWFNSTISTSGMVGSTIRAKYVITDRVGYMVTYEKSFDIVIDAVEIRVYDEVTGVQILPNQIKLYNQDISKIGAINETTKLSTVAYAGLNSQKYIVNAIADGYYVRSSVVMVDTTTSTAIDMYLIAEGENVIYEKFTIANSYGEFENSDYIIRLDKPVGDSTVTVFKSYFDFNGIASTYLMTNDAYILYIISPTATYNYGWLTPDADGEIKINVNKFAFSTIEDWISYTYNEGNETVSFNYESSKEIESASFIIVKDGTEVFNSAATTDTGSFTYTINNVEGIYNVQININTVDGFTFTRNSVLQIGKGVSIDPFPEDYTLAFKSLVIFAFITLGVLALSSYRFDLACGFAAAVYAVAVYQEWCIGNIFTVSLIGIIAFAAIVGFHKKQKRSVY